ncbi:MAG TPA: MEDS domain-containing protein [Candidatus Thermoplasmatota archaeon]|nr:MEDS domain-containing protein [Candidatus Thermoplasmatota archaeon]
MSSAPVPPMRRDALESGRRNLAAHDHALHVFSSEAQLGEGLAAFVREGEAQNELCVFVHSFPHDEDAWRFLERSLEGRAPPRDMVLVRLYTQAFQGASPRIDHAHVAAVVDSLTALASKDGRASVRIFVDASRRYLGTGRADEWFAFEAWLGRRLAATVGLVCAYQKSDVYDPAHVARVLETHAYRFA